MRVTLEGWKRLVQPSLMPALRVHAPFHQRGNQTNARLRRGQCRATRTLLVGSHRDHLVAIHRVKLPVQPWRRPRPANRQGAWEYRVRWAALLGRKGEGVPRTSREHRFPGGQRGCRGARPIDDGLATPADGRLVAAFLSFPASPASFFARPARSVLPIHPPSCFPFHCRVVGGSRPDGQARSRGFFARANGCRHGFLAGVHILSPVVVVRAGFRHALQPHGAKRGDVGMKECTTYTVPAQRVADRQPAAGRSPTPTRLTPSRDRELPCSGFRSSPPGRPMSKGISEQATSRPGSSLPGCSGACDGKLGPHAPTPPRPSH